MDELEFHGCVVGIYGCLRSLLGIYSSCLSVALTVRQCEGDKVFLRDISAQSLTRTKT
jgi:hypothetical protein